MRILVFYQYFGTPNGSWSTRFYEFARRWVQAGHKVTIVTAPYEKSDIKAKGFISRQTIEGINIIVINSRDSNRASILKRSLNALLFSIIACWFAITQKADIAISSSGPITIGIPGLVSKLFGKKFVFEVRDLWPDGANELEKINNKYLLKIAYKFEKFIYKKSKTVITCSQGMSDSIKNRFPAINYLTIPNSSDISLFSPNGFRNSYYSSDIIKYFVYTGSLGLMDDASQFINAFFNIKRDDIRLIIIGDGDEKSDLENRVNNALNRNIIFIGLISKIEVVNWLNKAYFSIISFKNKPVIQTSSPNKMFDSFAAGVPIIQNTTGWIKELVEKEECGINVPPDNPFDMANAILKLADNIDLRNRMAKNAFRLAETEFNRDILSKKYLDELIKIYNSPPHLLKSNKLEL